MNRKKLAALIVSALTAITVTACATPQKEAETASAPQSRGIAVDAEASASIKGAAVPEAKSNGQSRVAVVYFSEPETAQKYDVQGSTQYVAQVIQDKTGADIFRIERPPCQRRPFPYTREVLPIAPGTARLLDVGIGRCGQIAPREGSARIKA